MDKTTAYTKGAKKRARKARKAITLAGGETAPQRPRQGRRNDLPDGPPPIHAARARRCKADPASVLNESDMGRCILTLTPPPDKSQDERRRIGGTWATLSAARRNYLARIIGRTGDPQGAAIAMVPDRMETDQSLRVDLRSPDERDAAAERQWLEWCGKIEKLPTPQHKWALRSALDGFMGDGSLWRDGEPTASGRAAVQALKLLTDAE